MFVSMLAAIIFYIRISYNNCELLVHQKVQHHLIQVFIIQFFVCTYLWNFLKIKYWFLNYVQNGLESFESWLPLPSQECVFRICFIKTYICSFDQVFNYFYDSFKIIQQLWDPNTTHWNLATDKIEAYVFFFVDFSEFLIAILQFVKLQTSDVKFVLTFSDHIKSFVWCCK